MFVTALDVPGNWDAVAAGDSEAAAALSRTHLLAMQERLS